MKKKAKKLGLTRETLSNLAPESLQIAAARALATDPAGPAVGTWLNCCQESIMVCSVRESCVSCNTTGGTIIAVG
ncbi:MAG TPA: hypothetical protein VEL74_12905 [Thermoanaerobaculia bacterium]|nr:hypothetical protein [Thermoanaerobaculia bacterium]